MPRLSDLLPDLCAHLSTLGEMIVEMENKAGPDLQNFSVLSRRKIRDFERRVREFWRSYAKVVREADDFNGTGIRLKGEECLRLFFCTLMHAKEGVPFPRIQVPKFLALGHEYVALDRVWIATRLFWVQRREQLGREVYIDEERYGFRPRDRNFLLGNLDEAHKWLVDWAVVPTWEMAVFIFVVNRSMDLRRDWDDLFYSMKQQMIERGMVCPRLESFTTPATEEAMEIRDEGGDKMTCPICRYHFGHAYSNDDETEPAVKTRCNHIFGERCLETWVDTNRSTCPYCRTTLYGEEDTFPENIREHYLYAINSIMRLEDLDEETDAVLKLGNVEVHREGFELLVNRLHDFTMACNSAIGRMRAGIRAVRVVGEWYPPGFGG